MSRMTIAPANPSAAEADATSPSRFMRAEAAAEFISAEHFPCTMRFIKQETERGNLAHYFIRGVRHYTAEDIAEWVNGMRRVGTSGGAA
ncbi:hypothetical protein ABZU78_14705 [Rhodococcus erythropolis]|uniref:hypothetical protein n=1 Tax=Rhodococcus erythropolis TaxID=1833 RepID=UPI0033BC023A